MNKKFIKLIFTIFTIFTLVGCSNSSQENNSQVETEQSEDNQEAESTEANAETINYEEHARFINEAFNTLLNYDNSNYDERTNNLSNYFVNELAQNLTSNEHINTDMMIESSTSNEGIYRSLQGNTSYIYKTDVVFTVEDNAPTLLNNVYIFNLLEKNGEYLIGELEIITQPQEQEIPLQVEEEDQVQTPTLEEQEENE